MSVCHIIHGETRSLYASFSMLLELPQLAAGPKLEEGKILTGRLAAISCMDICIALAVWRL